MPTVKEAGMMNNSDKNIFERFSSIMDAAEMKVRHAKSPSLSASALVAYARRDNSLHDFQIERDIRKNPAARRIYEQALTSQSMASSLMALAAGDGRILKRVLDEARLEIIEDGDDVFLIVRPDPKAKSVPRFLEVRGEQGEGGRIELAKPVHNIIQLQLDMGDETIMEAFDLLTQPDASVHLLP